MKTRIMYIERKSTETGAATLAGGDARIGRVTFSKTMQTVYYAGKTFERVRYGYKYNHIDAETSEHYWISGCRKDGRDRLYSERVPIDIDDDVREEYWSVIRNLPQYVDQTSRF